ncbi:hypothetical protein ACP70R_043841 [Stipagrostis hirtigluma subsp. patula]
MLDVNLFRTGKDKNGDPELITGKGKRGDPELIRKSQRSRFAPVELVDEVTALDKALIHRQFELDGFRRELNAASKRIGRLKVSTQGLSAMEADCAALDAMIAAAGDVAHEPAPIGHGEGKLEDEAKKLMEAMDEIKNRLATKESQTQDAMTTPDAAAQFDLDTIWQELNDTITKIIVIKSKQDEELKMTMESTAEIKKRLAAKEAEVQEAKTKLDAKLKTIGNIVHDSVPVSDDEANNAVVRTWGERRSEDNLKNHVDLCRMLGIVDLEKGADVAGGRGYYLKDDGVMLNQALINFGLAFLRKRGFELMQTPFFMRKEAMEQCAQLAQFHEELYKITGDGEDKYLIATSEQPMCAYYCGDRIHPDQLPIRKAGYSTCFRKEAGSRGRDTAGIFRVHQFEKIEQFCITSPNGNDSWEMLEEMIKNSEDFYKELGLPYRVVSIVSGALNDAAAKKYDLEAWFPASKTYRELVSCSNCTDYLARRLETRYVQKKNYDTSKKFVHMLNSTLTATERTICCILENYQKEDGVEVPKVLQPYMGGTEFIPFR